MALFVIGDLHLPFGIPSKTMEEFGGRWIGYTEKLKNNWLSDITDDDTVLIAGDTSWGMSLQEALPDLQFLNSLPGKKLILEGNHDFWWNTAKKMEAFFEENSLDFSILRNNAYDVGDLIVCGARGWYTDEKNISESNADSAKIVNRENMRLQMSLKEGDVLREQSGKPIIAVLHFPPIYGNYICKPLVQTLEDFNVKLCLFGHIHGVHRDAPEIKYGNVRYKMISADHLNFKPYKIIY